MLDGFEGCTSFEIRKGCIIFDHRVEDVEERLTIAPVYTFFHFKMSKGNACSLEIIRSNQNFCVADRLSRLVDKTFKLFFLNE